MPESIPDYSTRILELQGHLNFISRDIKGLTTSGVAALQSKDEDCSFETRLEANERDYEKYVRLWEELMTVKNLKGDKFPDDKWQNNYDSVRQEILQGRAILKRIERQKRNEVPLPAHAIETSSNNLTFQASAKAHLPKIPIPQFAGDITKWSHFKDTYVSLVHNEPGLSNVERFHYLLGALKGEAASLVSSFPIEDASYDQAWEKLTKTYGNTRVLGSLLVQKIVECDLKSARSDVQRYDLFLTRVADSIESFLALKIEEPAEFLLSCLALRALDGETRRQFELTQKSDGKPPKSADVINFVRQRKIAHKMSEDICSSNSSSSYMRSSTNKQSYPNRNSTKYNAVALHSTSDIRRPSSPRTSSRSSSSSQHSVTRRCLQCGGNHHLSRCKDFQSYGSPKRFELVRGWKTCFNCLSKGHTLKTCNSKFTCRLCHKKHHTLLHIDRGGASEHEQQIEPQPKNVDTSPTPPGAAFTGFGSSTSGSSSLKSIVLLGTIRTLIRSDRGDLHSVRAVLDSGSQQSFATTSLIRKIGADISPFRGYITSLAESAVPQSHLKGVASCYIQSCDGSRQLQVSPVVVDCITSSLPSCNISSHVIESLKNKSLADYEFCDSAPVELLIGGDLYPQVITGAPFPSEVEDLYLTPSIFGLVVSGKLKGTPSATSFSLFTESHSTIEKQLKAFWDLEEPIPVDRTHPDDVHCEQHFLHTHSRSEDGRYMVRLPVKQEPTELGHNRDQVVKRFLTLEQKLLRNKDACSKYSEFMKEYIDLKHMSLANKPVSYLIPHHGVWQEGPQGKKLRVVFDASCPSSSGSLNNALYAGPKLQRDLSEILLRFRLYPIPLCADLVKMYRQILVHPDDRHYQHILWRAHPLEKLQEYELNTVTYGVKSSAYQALRVVKQLVADHGHQFPLAAKRVSSDMYVDDIVSGADSVEEALLLQQELCDLFIKGGFSLGKWASTLPQLLPSSEESVQSVSLLPSDEDCVKILGLIWNSSTDSFSYAVSQPTLQHITKRGMLSCTARIFDPLGLLAPVIFKAKSLIQDVWKSGIGWDEELPNPLALEWKDLTTEWSLLSTISIPRYISLAQSSFKLVGFCDASSKGYSAALYLRVEDQQGTVRASLIKAKTKVAPLKFLSISRLELCSALLLARLISSTSSNPLGDAICFTDSQVALTWINTPVHELKVFEANRVSQIVGVIQAKFWRHVRSEDNPADVASRGCSPRSLIGDPLWWHGPSWLTSPISEWFDHREETVVMTSISSSSVPKAEPYNWVTRFSSLPLLIRSVAWILRWRYRPSVNFPCHITAKEFAEAELRIISYVQRSDFPKDIFASKPSQLYSSLSPFLDERGIIRVGGRLEHSPLPFTAKHPILLPPKSQLSRLVVDNIHRTNFHSGPSLTLSLLRNKFWIPRAPKLIRSCISQCTHCRRLRGRPLHPFMAALPKERFHEFKAFAETGVDYAGPFHIKMSNRRNANIGKAYLCLFVCLSSKALHLELVTSLSTSAFLAALERFIARRGAPSTLWSDHGTNFVGASHFLKDLYKFHKEIEPSITHSLAPRGIEWKFIPPRAPHFGGMWEAGVKSVKRLLAGSIGKEAASYEDLMTALTKIEALLNSRPLCPLSEDAENFDFLTPGHFLIGTSLSALPEPPLGHFNMKPLSSRWEAMQAKIAHVWERWRKEYLHSLQQRGKWVQKAPEIQPGDLVILLERRSVVGTWPVARVTKAFPGRDGVTRVVEVKTPSGKVFTRAVTSLVPLFCPESKNPK